MKKAREPLHDQVSFEQVVHEEATIQTHDAGGVRFHEAFEQIQHDNHSTFYSWRDHHRGRQSLATTSFIAKFI